MHAQELQYSGIDRQFLAGGNRETLQLGAGEVPERGAPERHRNRGQPGVGHDGVGGCTQSYSHDVMGGCT